MAGETSEILASIRADLDVALAEHGTFEGVAGRAAVLAQRLLRADGASLTQRIGDVVIYIAASGSVASLKGRRVNMEGSSTGDVLKTGEAFVFNPDSAKPGSRERARVNDVRSGLIVPVISDGDVVGTVGVVSTLANAFDEVALQRLRSFANMLADGIGKQRERADRRSRLREAAMSASQAPFMRGSNTSSHPFQRQDSNSFKREGSNHGFERSGSSARIKPLTDKHAVPSDQELIDVGKEIQRAVSLARPLVEEYGELQMSIPAKIPTIAGESGRLWHAVLNVLKNAARAIELQPGTDHEVEVHVAVFKNALIIKVADTGIGISDDHLPLVFDGFFSAWPGARGSGLGLTVVRDTLIELGGTIEIDSSPGRTVVRMTFDL